MDVRTVNVCCSPRIKIFLHSHNYTARSHPADAENTISTSQNNPSPYRLKSELLTAYEIQTSKCLTHSVTALVRAICSSGGSKVRPILSLDISDIVDFRFKTEHGPVRLSTFLINYHVGDIVDIKANAAQQKGMPHKYYHGYVCSQISLCSWTLFFFPVAPALCTM